MTDINAVIVPVTPFQQNCSIVWCTKTMKAAVIDPGGDVAHIKNALADRGVTVEKILLTHGHIDHAGGAAQLAADLGVAIEGPHEADRFLLEGLEEQGREFQFPGARNVSPERWLDEGDSVTVGDLAFDVYHCPGHTPGHVIFVHKASKLAIVGDVLFKGSIGRTDLPGGDHEALLTSIREKMWPLGNDITFLPGHGPLSTIGEERQTNPFVHD